MINFDVDKGAQQFAERFVVDKVTSAQLRRFYNDFKNLERKYALKHHENPTEKDNAFKEILPQIKLTKAKVAYAKARKTVPESFREWLTNAVTEINSSKRFEEFLLHFEAIVGFAYGAGLNDKS